MLLFDEPTNTLDAGAIVDLTAMLADLRARDRTLLVASHRADTLDLPVDGALLVENQRVRSP